MNVGDNVFHIIRKGTGYPREWYVPVKIKSYSEDTKMYVVELPNGKNKTAVREKNLAVKNHRGELNTGRK